MVVSATAPLAFSNIQQQIQKVRAQENETQLTSRDQVATDIIKRNGRSQLNNEQSILAMRQFQNSRGSFVDIFA